MEKEIFVHETAEVEAGAEVGDGTRIWRHAHVRKGAHIGEECNIGKGVFVDLGVKIGSRVKIQNHVSVFEGVTIEDGVFIGPHVCFTNDLYPRAITVAGHLKSATDWQVTPTVVRRGASLGAASVIVCGVTIGEFALVGAGAVVTRNVAPHTLVLGNPARFHSYICYCAHPLTNIVEEEWKLIGWCESCAKEVQIPLAIDE